MLIFLPILYSGKIFHIKDLSITIIAFLSFSLIASAVYVQNDILDVEKDRKHPKKKERPIAKGTISIKNAKIFFCALVIISLLIQFTLYKINLLTASNFFISTGFLLFYLGINIFYSRYLKKIPIIELFILSIGFLIRVYYGGEMINVSISSWLYLTVLSFSLYLGIGKRRGEILYQKKQTREVLKYYPKEFLNKAMSMFLTLTLVFYSLWCTMGYQGATQNNKMIYSVFIILFITLRYSLLIEGKSDADPIEVLTKDKTLIVSICIYAIYIGVVLYV